MSDLHEYKPNRAQMDSDKQRCLECGEPPDGSLHHPAVPEDLKQRMLQELQKQAAPPPRQEWAGQTPFFLVFERGPSDNVGIDVDTGGWIESNKELFRLPGVWLLMHKEYMRPVMSVVMGEGEQFYFVKHHVGNLMAGAEVVVYGMGKKRADGDTVNLWFLPNGMVVGGDEGEADLLASRMLGPQRP